ncbi:hypothetical protein M9H77_13159 [Catharanthus roseus]|uniref:Uncharacterized protein n=1 Tax=Catharanthus roseus TaxID=4058 RepID=A0ACC0BJJ0_CATRO|nr:hypothetical protein M9H77_13159 [Catharanthus roseus]
MVAGTNNLERFKTWSGSSQIMIGSGKLRFNRSGLGPTTTFPRGVKGCHAEVAGSNFTSRACRLKLEDGNLDIAEEGPALLVGATWNGGSGISTEGEGKSKEEEAPGESDRNEAATGRGERLAVDIEVSRDGEGRASAEWVDGLGKNKGVVMGCRGDL